MVVLIAGIVVAAFILFGRQPAGESRDATNIKRPSPNLLNPESKLTEEQPVAGRKNLDADWQIITKQEQSDRKRVASTPARDEFERRLDRYFAARTRRERDALLDEDLARWDKKKSADSATGRKASGVAKGGGRKGSPQEDGRPGDERPDVSIETRFQHG